MATKKNVSKSNKAAAKKPAKKAAAPAKKAVKKAAPAKKTTAKAPAKKAAPKKAAVKKTVAKKEVKKAAPKKAAPAPKKAVKKAEVSKAPAKATKPAAPKAKAAPAAKTAPVAKPASVVKAAPAAKPAPKPAAPAPKPSAPVVKVPVAPVTKEKNMTEKEIVKTVTNLRYSDADLAEFKQLIQHKLSDAREELINLQAQILNANENGTDDTGASFKMLEDGSETLAKEEAANLAARQKKFIEQLESALVRIENKTYGICRVTGQLIPKERLRAVPHTTQSMEAKLKQYRD